MKITKFLSLLLGVFMLSSCSVTLLTPSVTINEPITGYKFFYVANTTEKTSTSGYVYDGSGSSTTRSINPSDIISGELMKRGFTKVPQITEENAERTFIVNYGETGKRDVGLFWTTTEVTLQFISAKDQSMICSSTAEGFGETEADDVRMAIERSIEAVLD